MRLASWIGERSRQEQQKLLGQAETLRVEIRDVEAQYESAVRQNREILRLHAIALKNYDDDFKELLEARARVQKELRDRLSKFKTKAHKLETKIARLGAENQDSPEINALVQSLASANKGAASCQALLAKKLDFLARPEAVGLVPIDSIQSEWTKLKQEFGQCEKIHRLEAQRLRYLEYATRNQVRLQSADGRALSVTQTDQFDEDVSQDFLLSLIKQCNKHRQDDLLELSFRTELPCCIGTQTWPEQYVCRKCGSKLVWSVPRTKDWLGDVQPFNIGARRPMGALAIEDSWFSSDSDTE